MWKALQTILVRIVSTMTADERKLVRARILGEWSELASELDMPLWIDRLLLMAITFALNSILDRAAVEATRPETATTAGHRELAEVLLAAGNSVEVDAEAGGEMV